MLTWQLIYDLESHPVWVRGLKPERTHRLRSISLSHPVWVRGLKLFIIYIVVFKIRRTPCGCVD